MLPIVFHCKTFGNINSGIKYSSLFYVANFRRYSLYNDDRLMKNFTHNTFTSGMQINRNHLNLFHQNQPNFKLQQRHISDYMDGRSIYKWLSETTPVEYTQHFLVSIHDLTGLPWWATIIGTTILLRFSITLPLAIYQTFILAKVENIALVEMPEVAKDVKKEVAKLAIKNNWDEKRTQLAYKRMLKNEWDGLVIQENCHPFKGTVTLWFQLPMWIFFTTALRNLAYMMPHNDAVTQIQYLQMCAGGFLWIPNLTLPDTTWFLPALMGMSNLAIIELQTLRRVRQAPLLQKYITNTFRCFSLLLIPISATVPSGVCLYWTTSSLIGLGQNLFLMSNRVRNTFRIPDTPTTIENPYFQLITDIKERGRNIKNSFRKLN